MNSCPCTRVFLCLFVCVYLSTPASERLTLHDGFHILSISPGTARPLVEHYRANPTESEQIHTL